MEKIIIEQSKELNGEVIISGSKNSSLPILAATILYSGTYKLSNVPDISDVRTMLKLIESLGGKYSFKNNEVIVDSSEISHYEAPYELVRTMRASVVVWGSLLGRFGKAKISFPGGCAIGDRPVDQHIKGFKSIGYSTKISNGYLETKKVTSIGGEHFFDLKSVTGCENVILASTLGDKKTILKNCSEEPEVVDLINFLNFCGGKIVRKGDTIEIIPSSSLKAPNKAYKIISDRIEAGTFGVLGCLPGNKIKLKNINSDDLKVPLKIIQKMGTRVDIAKSSITIEGADEIKPFNIKTESFPGFPTDLQAQFMVAALLASGESKIIEEIFPSRFIHVAELRKLGANIKLKNNTAIVNGVTSLNGARMQASDLRASACLILAGIIAKNKSEINRVYHLDRGYEKIDNKLMNLGVKIWREKE
jgi:UDP-N-acetylglucosamine 1-carboxyvinyltransferase